MTEQEQMYHGGYIDGLDDALNMVLSNPETAPREIRKTMGWTDCPDCDATGQNTNPTTRDLMMALVEDMGGRTGGGFARCRTCYGEGVIEPQGDRDE